MDANAIGLLFYLAGGLALAFRPRLALYPVAMGLLLTLPFQSWLLFRGIWCDFLVGCYPNGPHALFNPHPHALPAVIIGVLATILTFRAARV